MAVKCDISSIVLQKLGQLYWGTNTEYIDDTILQNYIEYLDCDTVELVECKPSTCTNETQHYICNIQIVKISSSYVQNVVTFFVESTDIINGVKPYSYQWDFEEDDFDNSGPIDTTTAVLTVKASKDRELLVTKIILKITDAIGCEVIKSCYLTPQGMRCETGYKACLPATGLTVRNKITLCVAPRGLLAIRRLIEIPNEGTETFYLIDTLELIDSLDLTSGVS